MPLVYTLYKEPDYTTIENADGDMIYLPPDSRVLPRHKR